MRYKEVTADLSLKQNPDEHERPTGTFTRKEERNGHNDQEKPGGV